MGPVIGCIAFGTESIILCPAPLTDLDLFRGVIPQGIIKAYPVELVVPHFEYLCNIAGVEVYA